MPFLTFFLLFISSFLLSELLRPKPNIENARPSDLGDFSVPTATEGRVVPLIWGRVKISGPNVIWYGDLRVRRLTKKVKVSLFKSKKVTTGFQYDIGMQMGLCRGTIDNLVSITIDDEQVYNTPISSGAYNIDKPDLFGGTGEDTQGGGGVVGGGVLFQGTEAQGVSSYLSSFQSPQPAYRGTSYITWEQGYIGNSPQLRAWAFEMERYPDTLNVTTPGEERIDDASNPMCVLHEILTNDEWGLAISPTSINEANLRVLATQMVTEGNGFAFVWDQTRNISEIISELERQVDGFLFIDPVTNEYNFKLVRFDYTPGTLAKLDESNITNFVSMSRSAWDETTNIVRVKYADPRKNYKKGFALAQDMANVEIVKVPNSVVVSFPGVKNPTLANLLAWRELRQLSFPLAKFNLELNRESFDLFPGSVRELNWPPLSIVEMPIRVTKIDYGNLDQGRIKVDFTQDVFGTEVGAFTDPPDTSWVPSTIGVSPLAVADQYMEEMPALLGGSSGRLVFLASLNAAGAPLHMIVMTDSRTPPSAFDDTYEEDSPVSVFAARGTLTNTYPSDTGVDPDTGGTLEVDPVGTEELPLLVFSEDNDDINFNSNNLAILVSADTYEYVAFRDVNDLGGNRVRLNTVWRGLLDTYPQSHPAGTTVWFLSAGANQSELSYTLDDAVQAKFLPESSNDVVLEAAATALPEVLMNNRQSRPPTPTELVINGGLPWDEDTAVSLDFDSDVSTVDRPGVQLSYRARDQRHTFAVLRQASGEDVSEEDKGESLLPYTSGGYENDPSVSGKDLRYRYWIYFVDKSTLSADPTTRRATSSMSGDTGVTGRNETFRLDRGAIHVANGDAVPSLLTVEIAAERDSDSLQSLFPIIITYSVVSSELSAAQDLGDLAINTTSAIMDVSGVAGSVTVRVQRPLDPFATTLGGEFQYRLDGGTWTQLTALSAIPSEGGLSGTVAVGVVNDLEVRHYHGWGLRAPLTVSDGGTLVAFGVLVPEFLDDVLAAVGAQSLAAVSLGDDTPIDFVLAASSDPGADVLTAPASELLYTVDDRIHLVRTDPILAVPRPAGSPETGVYVAHRNSAGGFLGSLKLRSGSTYLGRGAERQTPGGGTANAPVDLVTLSPATTPSLGDIYRVDANIVHDATLERSKNVRVLVAASPEGVLYNQPSRIVLVKPGTDAHFSSVTTGTPNPILATAVPTLAGDGSTSLAVLREMRIVVLLSSSQDLSQIYYKIGALTTNWKVLGTGAGTLAILDDCVYTDGNAALNSIKWAHTIDLDSATTFDVDIFDWSLVGPTPSGGDINGIAHFAKVVMKLDDV